MIFYVIKKETVMLLEQISYSLFLLFISQASAQLYGFEATNPSGVTLFGVIRGYGEAPGYAYYSSTPATYAPLSNTPLQAPSPSNRYILPTFSPTSLQPVQAPELQPSLTDSPAPDTGDNTTTTGQQDFSLATPPPPLNSPPPPGPFAPPPGGCNCRPEWIGTLICNSRDGECRCPTQWILHDFCS